MLSRSETAFFLVTPVILALALCANLQQDNKLEKRAIPIERTTPVVYARTSFGIYAYVNGFDDFQACDAPHSKSNATHVGSLWTGYVYGPSPVLPCLVRSPRGGLTRAYLECDHLGTCGTRFIPRDEWYILWCTTNHRRQRENVEECVSHALRNMT